MPYPTLFNVSANISALSTIITFEVGAKARGLRKKIASLKARQDKDFASKDQSRSRRIKKLMGLTKN
jgi:hypothetical protein